jgi:hypothetical protein
MVRLYLVCRRLSVSLRVSLDTENGSSKVRLTFNSVNVEMNIGILAYKLGKHK